MGNTATLNHKENEVLKLRSLSEKEERATLDLLLEHHKNVEVLADASHAGATYPPADNSAFEYNYKRLELPKDEEGYCISFSPENEQGYLEFFRKYGVVVVNSILTEEECCKSVDQLWEFIDRISMSQIQRNDPQSWENWPVLKSIENNLFTLKKYF